MSWSFLSKDDVLSTVDELRSGTKRLIVWDRWLGKFVTLFIVDIAEGKKLVLTPNAYSSGICGPYDFCMAVHGEQILLNTACFNQYSFKELSAEQWKKLCTELETENIYSLPRYVEALNEHLRESVVTPYFDSLDDEECKRKAKNAWDAEVFLKNALQCTLLEKPVPSFEDKSGIHYLADVQREDVVQYFLQMKNPEEDMQKKLEKNREKCMLSKGYVLLVREQMTKADLVEDWVRQLMQIVQEADKQCQYVTATFKRNDGDTRTVKVTPSSVRSALYRDTCFDTPTYKDSEGLIRWYHEGENGKKNSFLDDPPVSAIVKITHGRKVLFER